MYVIGHPVVLTRESLAVQQKNLDFRIYDKNKTKQRGFCFAACAAKIYGICGNKEAQTYLFACRAAKILRSAQTDCLPRGLESRAHRSFNSVNLEGQKQDPSNQLNTASKFQNCRSISFFCSFWPAAMVALQAKILAPKFTLQNWRANRIFGLQFNWSPKN